MADHHTSACETVIVPSTEPAPGVDVIDPIERLRRTVRTASPVEPAPADPDRFPMPVETAVEVETEAITLPVEAQVIVRGGDGQMVDEIQLGERRSFPDDRYFLEPLGLIKMYLGVESALDVRQEGEQTTFQFGESVRVVLGSCSTHKRPATTVSIRDDPADLLDAISTFGSALKTLDPERSFPSNRGHPPAVEIGDRTEIPEDLTAPEERIWIEVPAQYEPAFLVAPLAYYLGVPVRDGPVPQIVSESIEYPLASDGDLETGVSQILKRLFLLDCITRTEGIYQLDLHEREVADRDLDLSFKELYDATHEERLTAYLNTPFESVAHLMPSWKHAAHVEPTPDNVQALPYLADDLAIVKTAVPESVPAEQLQSGATQGLVRGSSTTASGSFVHPADPMDAIEEAWVGDGTPVGPSKALPEAFQNRVGRTPSDGSIEIAVVCNSEEMAEEKDVVDEAYGSRDGLPFDVTVQRDLSTEELASCLAEERDFLHYIGHIDDEGFRCSDGRLNAGVLDDVGADAFFLNACQSYEQGEALVEAGAIGGIVTLRDVANFGAVQIGSAVARLLNCGFPLRPALNVARGESVIGCHYIVVGDGGITIVQPQSGTPHVMDVEKKADGFEVSLDLFGAPPGMGGLFSPHATKETKYYLASGEVPKFQISSSDFETYLHREECPIRRNGWLEWSTDLRADDF